ncbi:aminotransferase class IV [Hymenobacter sp. GOD-10R]|uniref:aminotransferase class IV n=1 Tax=Hymenobacter sp. GOD-10R TaxID=3093922 RepID=UPI002D772A43|nr:aminotransferase class IV [Hymenobacter sp. GOD-10R]WRQ31010.1 aminotransferase class IV [Hymenobacter sp. GOD-10R]
MYVLLNGRLTAQQELTLALPNRGFYFNDGFFETLIWAEDAIRYGGHHVARMQCAAAVLGLELPETLRNLASLQGLFRSLLAANGLSQARVRLQIWRGGSGLYTPESNTAEFLVTAQPFVLHAAPVAQADFAETVRTHPSAWAFCKGPNALTYVLAGRERQRRGLDELLLLDPAGHVAEAGAAAIFWIRAGHLYTPALTTGCVAGVRRAHLLEVAQAHGIPCTEGLYQPSELLEAEAAFTANVAALRPLTWVAGVSLASASHALLQALQNWEAS